MDKNQYQIMSQDELNKKLLDDCINGKLDIVKYLLTSPDLKEPADINYHNNSGINSLMLACFSGHFEIVKYLLSSPELKEHANINDKDNEGWNALMWACDYGYLDIIKYLVIDMNMEIDEKIMNWLQGQNNEEERVCHEALKMIESRDLHQKLDNSINHAKINNKKVKV